MPRDTVTSGDGEGQITAQDTPQGVESSVERTETPMQEESQKTEEVQALGPQDAKSPVDPSATDGTEPETGSKDDAKRPATLLEAVEEVLKESPKGAEPSPADDQDAKAKADADAEEDKDGADKAKADSEDDPPFHEHPRWKQLVNERDDLKKAVEDGTEAQEAISRLESHMSSENISVEEFNRLLVVAGLMKNDPEKALEALTPYYRSLVEITGRTLTPELQDAVDQGFMTEDYAKQLARANAQNNVQASRLEGQNQRHEADNQVTHGENLKAYANEWDREWSGSDPDYNQKLARVTEKTELVMLREGPPKDRAGVRALLDRVKGEVDAELRSFLPKPRSITPNPVNSAATSGAQPAPKTMLEAMEAAV